MFAAEAMADVFHVDPGGGSTRQWRHRCQGQQADSACESLGARAERSEKLSGTLALSELVHACLLHVFAVSVCQRLSWQLLKTLGIVSWYVLDCHSCRSAHGVDLDA